MSTDPTQGNQPAQPTPPQQPPAPQQAQPPAPPEQPPAPSADDELAQLRQQIAELSGRVQQTQTQVDQATRVGQARASADALGIPEPPEGLPDYAHEWPTEGGLKLGDGKPAPQPWDLRSHGLKVAVDDEGGTTVVAPHSGQVFALPPGAEDTVSPIVPAHGRPILGPLTSDPAVEELGRLLKAIGFDNSVARGQNPQSTFDASLQAAVEAFRETFGVEEDPSQWPVGGRDLARTHVGPWTWEATLRAARAIEQEREQDGRVLTHR